MIDQAISLIMIIIYESCIILLQYDGKLNLNLAFFSQIPLILKVIDLMLVCLIIRVLYFVKQNKRMFHIMLALCLLRIGNQLTLCYFFQTQILSVFLNLNLIHNLYHEELDKNVLTRIPQLFLAGIICYNETFQDNIIIVGLTFTGLSIMYSFKPSQTIQEQTPQDIQKKSNDFDICISALPYKDKSYDVNVSNNQSPVYGGLSPIKDLSRSMDSQLLDEYAWIKGQQFVVLDEQGNVIIQTFNVADFSRTSFNNSIENESVAAILQLGIVQGNRDFQDLLASSGSINQSKFTLKDLINKLIGDYELYKNNMFIINKVDATWMQDWVVKIFLVNKFRKTFVFLQLDEKEVVYQPSYSAFTQFSAYITPSLNSIMTISVLAESDSTINDAILERYFFPIRIASVIIYLHLANMRDYNLHYQKKLLLKIHSIDVLTLCEDLIIMVQDASRARGIEIKTDADFTEAVESDNERLKQLMLPLLKYFIKGTKDDNITITWKQLGQKNYQVSIHSPINIDEKELRVIRLNLKKPTLQFSELSVCHLLAQYLSGTNKKGIEIASVEPCGTAFQFVIQSYNVNNEEMKAIRLIGGTHYQETSLSQLLAMQDFSKQNEQTYTLFREGTNKVSMDHSLHFSQSRISKQFSQRYSEYQSNYYSQISRIKADSANVPMSKLKDQHSFEQISMQNFNQDEETKHQKRGNFQTTPSQSKYQLPHFPDTVGNSVGNSGNNSGGGIGNNSNGNSFTVNDFREREQTFLTQPPSAEIKHQPQSSNLQLDFGIDVTAPIQIPVSIPFKMQSEIIKFSTTGKCCSRVLIADCEFQNIQILEMILGKFKIISTRAFSTEEVINLMQTKKKCKCGNNGFVLYFINVDLPKKGGLWLSRQIKDKMIQKCHIIGTTGLVEYYSKIEYYKNGIDQYISLPFDLNEVSKILQISQKY